MTKTDLIKSLYSISHSFNGMYDVPKSWLSNYINKMVDGDRPYYMSIGLPDGDWLLKIYKYSDKEDGYDYFIPENREEELTLWGELINKPEGA